MKRIERIALRGKVRQALEKTTSDEQKEIVAECADLLSDGQLMTLADLLREEMGRRGIGGGRTAR